MMLFSSPIFLYVFLPIALLGGRFAPSALSRNIFLVLLSFVFYTWGELEYVPLILVVIAITHFGSVYQVGSGKRKWFVLSLSVTLLISLLAFFKYYTFVLENLTSLGWNILPQMQIDLPLGISFFTFQAISQLVDVYRKSELVKFRNISFLETSLYILLFPQLIAGPIVRFGSIVAQMGRRCDTPARRSIGIKLFIVGLAMKVIIADKMAPIADQTFSLGLSLDPSEAWLGAFAYSMQIYFDFAGYSNMAIGLGIFFGFSFPTNFRDPYVAMSITDFWRRWHISLSSWFRDYLYIPIGGNRKGRLRTILNLFIVFFATGIWHGASWNFVVWGLWHGLFMIGERMIGRPSHWVVGRLYTLLVVVIGWVAFRAGTLDGAVDYVCSMFGQGGDGRLALHLHTYLKAEILLIGAVGLFFALVPRRHRRRVWLFLVPWPWLQNTALTLLFVLCMMYVASSTYSPFLYFRF